MYRLQNSPDRRRLADNVSISPQSHKPLHKPTSHENVMAMVTWRKRKTGAQGHGGRDKTKGSSKAKKNIL